MAHKAIEINADCLAALITNEKVPTGYNTLPIGLRVLAAHAQSLALTAQEAATIAARSHGFDRDFYTFIAGYKIAEELGLEFGINESFPLCRLFDLDHLDGPEIINLPCDEHDPRRMATALGAKLDGQCDLFARQFYFYTPDWHPHGLLTFPYAASPDAAQEFADSAGLELTVLENRNFHSPENSTPYLFHRREVLAGPTFQGFLRRREDWLCSPAVVDPVPLYLLHDQASPEDYASLEALHRFCQWRPWFDEDKHPAAIDKLWHRYRQFCKEGDFD